MYNPDYHGILYIDQDGLKVKDLPVSAFEVLGLKYHHAWPHSFLELILQIKTWPGKQTSIV